MNNFKNYFLHPLLTLLNGCLMLMGWQTSNIISFENMGIKDSNLIWLIDLTINQILVNIIYLKFLEPLFIHFFFVRTNFKLSNKNNGIYFSSESERINLTLNLRGVSGKNTKALIEISKQRDFIIQPLAPSNFERDCTDILEDKVLIRLDKVFSNTQKIIEEKNFNFIVSPTGYSKDFKSFITIRVLNLEQRKYRRFPTIKIPIELEHS